MFASSSAFACGSINAADSPWTAVSRSASCFPTLLLISSAVSVKKRLA